MAYDYVIIHETVVPHGWSVVMHVDLSGVGQANGDEAELPFSLPLDFTVRDAEVIAALMKYPEGEPREHFAEHALKIGVLALRYAQGEFDAQKMRRESERLLEDVQRRLQQHSDDLNGRIKDVLREYFDPNSGHFPVRVQRLIDGDGELKQLLGQYVGDGDSHLTRSLVKSFGEGSKLLRWLSPDESQGLLAAMRTCLDSELSAQRESVLREFSLDNKEGALSRLVGEVKDHSGRVSGDLQEKIQKLVGEFSLDDDRSALSRLVKSIESAEQKITGEFSLDDNKSALARLQRELLKVIEKQAEDNQKFQEEVRVTLGKLEARREESRRSTRHGHDFQADVFAFLQRDAQQTGDMPEDTGSRTGAKKHCKVGDAVVQIGPENVAAGARFVVEAKEDASYTLAKAATEIEVARKNRMAQVGVFVFSKRTAPEGIDAISRRGQDVIAVWDADDEQTNVYLWSALTLARAMCVRERRHDQLEEAVDFRALEESILAVEKQADLLTVIEKSGNAIGNHAKKILERVARSRAALKREAKKLRKQVGSVRNLIEMHESVP